MGKLLEPAMCIAIKETNFSKNWLTGPERSISKSHFSLTAFGMAGSYKIPAVYSSFFQARDVADKCGRLFVAFCVASTIAARGASSFGLLGPEAVQL